jgi:dTMP kinase
MNKKTLPPFIVVEGPDGVGKSTICNWLSEEFGYKKFKCMSEPFYSVSKYFEEGKVTSSERFSFLCGEAINNSFIIKKALKNGNKIVFDRYYFSSLAYSEILETGITNDFLFLFKQLPQPDLVFLITADFNTMLQRIEERGDFEKLENKFKTVETYHKLINNYKSFLNDNSFIINNNGKIETIKAKIGEIIKSNQQQEFTNNNKLN